MFCLPLKFQFIAKAQFSGETEYEIHFTPSYQKLTEIARVLYNTRNQQKWPDVTGIDQEWPQVTGVDGVDRGDRVVQIWRTMRRRRRRKNLFCLQTNGTIRNVAQEVLADLKHEWIWWTSFFHTFIATVLLQSKAILPKKKVLCPEKLQLFQLCH